MNPKGIVISPGPGNPAKPRDIGNCLEIIKNFHRTPILGVCLGHQAMNLAYGGTVSHTKPLHGKTSDIWHDGKSIFRGLENPLIGGRYHSLAVETLSPMLEISASTIEGVVMGIRHTVYPHEGVQFHPESVLTPQGKKIISNWVEDVKGFTH